MYYFESMIFNYNFNIHKFNKYKVIYTERYYFTYPLKMFHVDIVFQLQSIHKGIRLHMT